jgi:hypothetical protein
MWMGSTFIKLKLKLKPSFTSDNVDHNENNCKPQKHLSNGFRHDKVKINRANRQTGGKNRRSTFVLTAVISFGLFNVFLLRASPPVLSM